MALNVICPACGSENLITRPGADNGDLLCSVCGERLDAPSGGQPPRKSAFGRSEAGNLNSNANASSGGDPRGDGRPLEPDSPANRVYAPPPRYDENYGRGSEMPRRRHSTPISGQIIIALIIITFVAVAYIQKKDRLFSVKTRVKMCISNMKTIEGAVELYLMENDTDDKRYGPDFGIGTLVSNGYLRTEPKCSEKGRYKIKLTKSGKTTNTDISCEKHGSLLELTLGDDKPIGL
jgi:hypothetical protein